MEVLYNWEFLFTDSLALSGRDAVAGFDCSCHAIEMTD